MSQYRALIRLQSLDSNRGFQINGEAAHDFSGASVSSAGDVNGDGFTDVIVGAWKADPNGKYSGASYVVFGKASGWGSTLDLSSLDGNNGFKMYGEAAYDQNGFSVSDAGDINGDGFGDVIVGAKEADPNGSSSGASYVVFGTDAGFSATLDLSSLDGNNGFKMYGEAVTDLSGFSVSSAGDVNGDGFTDLIVGAPQANPHSNDEGVSYVVFGTDAGFSATLNLSSLDGNNGFKLNGEAQADLAGFSVSLAGDVNGDGFDDLIVGAPFVTLHEGFEGASYVVFGTDAGFGATLELSSLDGGNGFKMCGEGEVDLAGFSVSSAGDVNADGFADLIVGAPQADPSLSREGTSYVVFGKASGFGATLELSSLDGNNGFRINGVDDNDFSGRSVSSAGDVNGDGFADLIVGAPNAVQKPHNENGHSSGAAYVVFGKASGFGAALELSSLDGNNGFQISGAHADALVGFSVSSAGDINGDGFADFIVGASGDRANDLRSGASYVIFGSMPREAVTRIGTDIANTIHGGNFQDTLSGLNGDDTLYGHGGHDVLGGGAGNDTMIGGAGKDTLNGGIGADRFIYAAASDSTSKSYDTIKQADFMQDAFDAPETVSAIDAGIVSGALSQDSFDDELAAAVDSSHLGIDHAVLFTPDSGSLAGKTFLIVDTNGVAGYQAGADLVINLLNPLNLASLDADDFV